MKLDHNVTLTKAIPGPTGEPTTVLTFRRPIVKDLRVFDDSKGDADGIIKLVSALTGLPPSHVEQIDLVDWTAVTEKAMSFFPSFNKPTAPLK